MRKTKIICTLGPAVDSEPALRRLILAHSDREVILASARKNGFLSLADRCRELVLEGVTSAEEAARTIHSTDD